MEKRDYTKAELDYSPRTTEELTASPGDVLERMRKTIEAEGPIRESLLIKRVLNSYDLYRNGSTLSPFLSDILSRIGTPVTVDGDGGRVFHTGGNEDYFRPTPDGDTRYSYQIPYSEAANCLIYIMENGEKNSYTKSELYRLFLSEMGYLRSGDQIEKLFDGALADPRIRRSGNGRILK